MFTHKIIVKGGVLQLDQISPALHILVLDDQEGINIDGQDHSDIWFADDVITSPAKDLKYLLNNSSVSLKILTPKINSSKTKIRRIYLNFQTIESIIS